MGDLRVRLLGGLEIEGWSEAEIGSRKARTLVKALALARNRPVGVDELVEVLWGDQPPARPGEQVSVLVSRLRRVLGAERLRRSDAGYALLVDWLDLDDLERRVAEATSRLAQGDIDGARVASAVALALDRGPLLPEEDGGWVDLHRGAAARLVANARRAAAQAALAAGDHAGVLEAAGRALDADPYDEESLRLVMRAHADSGRPAAALAAYAQARAVLAEDLGVSPAAATEALHGTILGSAEPQPAPPVGAPVMASETVGRWIDEHVAAGLTLRIAAVLGPTIDVELLAAPSLASESLPTVLAHLDEALAAGLLVEIDGSLDFASEDVRQALAAGISQTRSVHLHREAARLLATRDDVDPLQVAHQAAAGNMPALAARHLLAAAEQALQGNDVAAGVTLAQDAVALQDDAAAHMMLARARLVARDLQGARAEVDAAVAGGGGAPALELAGWVAYYQRDLAAARVRAEEGALRATDQVTLAGCRALTGRLRHSAGDLTGAEDHLRQAAAAAAPVRGLAEIWLGGVLAHRGESDLADDAAQRGLLERAALSHPFAAFHGLFTRAYALGQRGRAAEALQVSDTWLAELIAAGESGLRYLPVALNLRGWLLRQLGRQAEADESNDRALAAIATARHEEPRNHALLDLADGALLAGDLARAETRLTEVRLVDDDEGTMVWHQRQRFWLLRSRLATLTDVADDGEALAATLVDDARGRGSRRAVLLGLAALANARARGGQKIDLDEVAAVLTALEAVAGLEVWRITAELAAATGVERWWTDAERRAADLLSYAGEGTDPLRAHIARELDRLGR